MRRGVGWGGDHRGDIHQFSRPIVFMIKAGVRGAGFHQIMVIHERFVMALAIPALAKTALDAGGHAARMRPKRDAGGFYHDAPPVIKMSSPVNAKGASSASQVIWRAISSALMMRDCGLSRRASS